VMPALAQFGKNYLAPTFSAYDFSSRSDGPAGPLWAVAEHRLGAGSGSVCGLPPKCVHSSVAALWAGESQAIILVPVH